MSTLISFDSFTTKSFLTLLGKIEFKAIKVDNIEISLEKNEIKSQISDLIPLLGNARNSAFVW